MNLTRACDARQVTGKDVGLYEMEDPRTVEAAAKGFVAISAAVAVALSLFFWSFVPIAFWAYLAIGTAIAFVLVVGVYAVTIWPLVLVIAKLFGRSDRRGEPNVPVEPTPQDGAAHRQRSAALARIRWWTEQKTRSTNHS